MEEQENQLQQAVEEFKKSSKSSSGSKSRSKSKAGSKAGNKSKASGRRPVLTSWAMLKVRTGTVLNCTLSKEFSLTTKSDVTMECELFRGKRSLGRFLGLMKAEKAVRDMVGKPIKSVQGWDVFVLSDSPKKGQSETVHKRYNRMVQPS